MENQSSMDSAIEVLIKSFDYMLNMALSKTTQIYEGIIVSNNNDGRWNIQYNGEIHPVKPYGSIVPTVGTNGKFNSKNTEVEGTFILPEGWILPSGWSSRDTGCQKLTDTNYILDQDAMKKANLWVIDEKYWLASRYNELEEKESSQNCVFYVDSVYEDGMFVRYALADVANGGYYATAVAELGLRPVILLKPSVEVVSGDGSETSPFILEE